MSKKRNALWRFFASVKLALVSVLLLAATSIIGTVVQQRRPASYYVDEYGSGLARVFQLLDIPNMYSSWWFLALVSIFAVNLIVCSIERIPASVRMMVKDATPPDPERLEKMSSSHRTESGLPAVLAARRIQEILVHSGWKRSKREEREGSTVFFAQRGAWTRLGAHVVHLSILVIIAGAAVGNHFGYKAFVFLPEGRSTTTVYLQSNNEPVPIDFELYYDRYETALYPDGSIREYRSDLTVYDPERAEPYEKSSVVNDPLSYGGISFYIADNYPLEEYFVQIRNQVTGAEQAFRIPPEQQVTWPEAGISFSIEEVAIDREGAVRQAKIMFSDSSATDPATFWMDNKNTVTINRPGQDFTFSFRQLHSTLFLVMKDPGVMIVYFGFILMVIGLCISFFLSHQRIWIDITSTKNQGSRILVSGTTNKHHPAFERRFQNLVTRIEQDDPIATKMPKAAKPLKKRRAAA